MRTAIVGGALLLVGAILIATGILPVHDVLAVGDRVWPILLFVVAITVVTELAAEAGLFAVVAGRLARLGSGRAIALWAFIVVLACVCTIFLSLDTTAVLLTPVVIVLARQSGLPPLPFALTTVWLANSASLLLPVSNLTNLLAENAMHLASPGNFAALMALPALVAIVVPVVVLFVIFRRDLLSSYDLVKQPPIDDRVLLWVSGIVVLALLPMLVSGITVWIPTSVGALVLLAFFAVRHRAVVRFRLIPWQLVLLACGLFLVVDAAGSLGLTPLLAEVAGKGQDAVALLRMTGSGVVGANLLDNLPAYLALEPVARGTAGASPERIAALLVGVNAGPLITPWASLATLLWHQRLVALDVKLSWRRYMLLGLIVVPLTVIPASLMLLVGAG